MRLASSCAGLPQWPTDISPEGAVMALGAELQVVPAEQDRRLAGLLR